MRQFASPNRGASAAAPVHVRVGVMRACLSSYVHACVLSSVWLCASKYKCKYKYMYRDKHIGRRALFDRGIEKASTAGMAEVQAYKFGHLVPRGQRG